MKNKKLEVKVINSELRISIGVDTLKFAIENSPDFPLTEVDETTGDYLRYQINNPELFAQDVVLALLAEEEDGTTPVHILLDKAAFNAIENGSLAVDEKRKRK